MLEVAVAGIKVTIAGALMFLVEVVARLME